MIHLKFNVPHSNLTYLFKAFHFKNECSNQLMYMQLVLLLYIASVSNARWTIKKVGSVSDTGT